MDILILHTGLEKRKHTQELEKGKDTKPKKPTMKEIFRLTKKKKPK